MPKEAAEKNIHVLERDGKLGEVKIADEVVAMIAGLAATEVEAWTPWPEISPTSW